jgi:hypothetical protein
MTYTALMVVVKPAFSNATVRSAAPVLVTQRQTVAHALKMRTRIVAMIESAMTCIFRKMMSHAASAALGIYAKPVLGLAERNATPALPMLRETRNKLPVAVIAIGWTLVRHALYATEAV